MARFVICVSSVIEREDSFYDYRYIAKSVIERLGHEGVRNPEDVNNQNNFERTLNEECNFFVLLIGEKKSKMVENELRIALAKGIPIIALVKIRYDQQGKKIFPSKAVESIKKISPELYNMQISTFEMCEDLDKTLQRELENVIDRKIRLSPIIGQDPPIAYTEGLNLIRDAKYRLIVAQKSSCLILGPRIGASHEEKFYNALMDWIKKNRNQSAYFMHYYSLQETIEEARSGNYDLRAAKEKLRHLFDEPSSNKQVFFRASDNLECVQHVIGDTGIGLNFYIGHNRYYLFLPCFLTKDSELQQIIANTQKLGTKQNWKQIQAIYSSIDSTL